MVRAWGLLAILLGVSCAVPSPSDDAGVADTGTLDAQSDSGAVGDDEFVDRFADAGPKDQGVPEPTIYGEGACNCRFGWHQQCPEGLYCGVGAVASENQVMCTRMGPTSDGMSCGQARAGDETAPCNGQCVPPEVPRACKTGHSSSIGYVVRDWFNIFESASRGSTIFDYPRVNSDPRPPGGSFYEGVVESGKITPPACMAFIAQSVLGVIDLCAGEGILVLPEKTNEYERTQFRFVDDACRWDSARRCAKLMEFVAQYGYSERTLESLDSQIREYCPERLPFGAPCNDATQDQIRCLKNRMRPVLKAFNRPGFREGGIL